MIDSLLTWLQDQGACAQVQSAEPLKGGYWNAVYRIRGADFDLVLKQFAIASGQGLFPVLADDEARALAQLAGTSIAPQYHSYWPQAPGGAVLLYEFAPGHMWSDDVVAAGGLFKRLHATPVQGPFRTLPTQPKALLEQAQELIGGYIVQALGVQLETLCPPAIEVASAPKVLVHTDSGPGNIIQSADAITFIDFQCPGMGDACEDLTCFLSPGIHHLYGLPALSSEQEQTYLSAYGEAKVLQRFTQMRVYYSYRMAAYFVMRYYSQQGLDEKVSQAYLKAAQLEISSLEFYR
jgi:hypothetical protein